MITVSAAIMIWLGLCRDLFNSRTQESRHFFLLEPQFQMGMAVLAPNDMYVWFYCVK